MKLLDLDSLGGCPGSLLMQKIGPVLQILTKTKMHPRKIKCQADFLALIFVYFGGKLDL